MYSEKEIESEADAFEEKLEELKAKYGDPTKISKRVIAYLGYTVYTLYFEGGENLIYRKDDNGYLITHAAANERYKRYKEKHA